MRRSPISSKPKERDVRPVIIARRPCQCLEFRALVAQQTCLGIQSASFVAGRIDAFKPNAVENCSGRKKRLNKVHLADANDCSLHLRRNSVPKPLQRSERSPTERIRQRRMIPKDTPVNLIVIWEPDLRNIDGFAKSRNKVDQA